MNVFEALSYPYNSPNWLSKFFVAFLLVFIPFVNIFGAIVLLGYGVKIIRNVMQGNTELPEFELGADFSDGLVVIAAGIIYYIPAMIVMALIGPSVISETGANLAGMLFLILLMFVLYFVFFIGVLRYSQEESFRAFFDAENLNLLTNNVGSVILLLVNLFLFSIIVSILSTIGFIFLVIPGLIIAIGASFSQYYLFAMWGMQIGLVDPRKAKEKHY